MRALLFFTSLSLLSAAASGCKHQGSPKLEGHWRGVRVEGVAPESQAGANAFAVGTELLAKGDQVAMAAPGQKRIQATYTVDSEDKNSLVIHTDKDGSQTLTFSADGKTMTWAVDERRKMTFQRVVP
jgi:hypothetical protein